MPTFRPAVSFRILGLLVFFVASLVALPPRAYPQASDHQPEPPEVRVVVTAKRLPEPAARVAGHVTVVEREQIESSNARTVVDLLDSVAGLSFQTYSGSTTDADPQVRGYGTQHTRFLLDGRPINPPDLGGIDWLSVPLAAVERIEIVRGGASAVHGDNAVAGTVNIITRGPGGDAAPSEPRFSAGVSGYLGSFGTAGGEAYLQSSEGPVDAHASYTQTTTDGQRERSAADGQSLQVALGFAPGADGGREASGGQGARGGQDAQGAERLRLDSRFSYSSSARELPGGISKDTYEDDPDEAANDADGARSSRYAAVLTSSWRGAPFELDIPLGASFRETETDFPSQSSFSDTAVTEVDLRPSFSMPLELGDSVGLELEGSADAVFTRLDYTGYSSAARADADREITLEEGTGGVSGGGRLSISELVHLTARGRFELRGVRAHTDDVEAVEDDRLQQGIGAQGGISVTPSRRLRVFARYDRVYRYPALDEQASYQGFGDEFYEDLDPEIGDSVELGFEIEPGDVLQLSAGGYYLDMRDEVVFVPGATAGTGAQENVERTERVGADVETTLRAGEVVEVSGSYSYTLARYAAGDNEGNYVAGVPAHTGRVEAEIHIPAGFSLEPSYEFSSAYYLDAANEADPDFARRRVSAYLSWYPAEAFGTGAENGGAATPTENGGAASATEDGGSSSGRGAGARLYAGVENLLDERSPSWAEHYDSIGETSLYPENGRSWQAGFSWRY